MSSLLPQPSSSASATGNPRNKTALKPGHSLMDWVRLRGSGVDLAGTKGVVTPVTLAELKKHNRKNDAWMAIRGKVYNVTRYMDFHPGGVDELMKGVGMDATKMFDDVHAWVNYDQMLNKCYIGPLCASSLTSTASKIVPSNSSSKLSTGSSLAANFRLPFSKSANNFISSALGSGSTSPTGSSAKDSSVVVAEPDAEVPPTIPRFDWIQKTTDLVLIFYTRAFCNPGILIECLDESSLEIRIFLEGGNTFLVKLTASEALKWPCVLRSSIETGKTEISFTKATPKLWSSYGTMEMTKVTDIELNEYVYHVGECWPLNHDSYAVILSPIKKLLIHLPVGHHVTVTRQVEGQDISRSYTPVPPTFIATPIAPTSILLLIKSYEHGTLSKYLCSRDQLAQGLRVSPPKGNFTWSKVKPHKRIAFLAAGSGLTPFLAIMEQFLNKPPNQLESLSLLYFNKTEKDIWCRGVLDALAQKEPRFHFKYILSEADASWDGERGRVTRDQIIALADPDSSAHVTFIGVCGPPAFNRQIVEHLEAVASPATVQHIFQG